MSNEQQFIIIVRFPAWEQNGTKFNAYGMKFLFTMPIIPFPEWEEDDERWFTYSEEKIVAKTFKKAFEESRKIEFNGEILFVEPTQLSTVESKEVVES